MINNYTGKIDLNELKPRLLHNNGKLSKMKENEKDKP